MEFIYLCVAIAAHTLHSGSAIELQLTRLLSQVVVLLLFLILYKDGDGQVYITHTRTQFAGRN